MFELRKLLDEGMDDVKKNRTLTADEAFDKARKRILGWVITWNVK